MREKLLTGCLQFQKMLRREKQVLEFWDRKNKLSVKNKEYKDFVQKIFYFLLEEDVKSGDITTNSLIKKNKKIFALIVAKEEGIIAGLEEFSSINKDLKLKFLKKDGNKIKSGEKILEIKGNAEKILERERVSLNLLQRMSGIATITNRLSKKAGNKIRLAATRKTLWGLLDKKAVSIGGGLTHRLNLNDGIIIKENHIKILNYNIKGILSNVKNKSKYIEIEVEKSGKALDAAKAIRQLKSNNLFAIMFDKIPPEDIKSIIGKFKSQNIYDNILFEASGNINENNLIGYIDCGADIISMGSITNSAKIIDMSLEIR